MSIFDVICTRLLLQAAGYPGNKAANCFPVCSKWCSTHALLYTTSWLKWRYILVAREVLPSDRVCKACFQGVENLLKVESNPSSILNMLNASIQPSVFTTLQIITNPYFQVPGVNIIEITECCTFWFEPPEFWRSIRNVCYINQTVFRALYCKQYTHWVKGLETRIHGNLKIKWWSNLPTHRKWTIQLQTQWTASRGGGKLRNHQ